MPSLVKVRRLLALYTPQTLYPRLPDEKLDKIMGRWALLSESRAVLQNRLHRNFDSAPGLSTVGPS